MQLTKIFSREYSAQYTEISICSLGPEVKQFVPRLILTQAYIPEQGNESCYVDADEWKSFLTLLEKRYSKNFVLENFFNFFHLYGRQYVAVAKKASAGKLAKKTNAELIKLYAGYQKIAVIYTAFLWMGYLLNNIFSDKVKNILADKKLVDADRILAALFTPAKLCGILLLQKQLASLKKRGRKLSVADEKKILKKYGWLSCLDIFNDAWSKKELLDFYSELKVGEKPSFSFEQAVRMAKLNKREEKFVRLANEMVYVKDMRDEYRRKAIYNVRPLFEEMSGRLGLRSRKVLAYFSSQEIIDALRDKNSRLSEREAKQRQKGFLIYLRQGRITVTADLDRIKKFVGQYVIKQSGEQNLRGISASLGIVRGAVKLVFGIKDLAKVQAGDIMVAITTHPDFVPAMHRSAGILTEEGGLTSHAAIVSRELKIPCVVGIKNLTKILKDGDIVEVDAEKGIIKKL